MTPSIHRLQMTAIALATALLVAACGGGDATPPAESIPPTVNVTSASGAGGAVTFTFTLSEDVGTSFTTDIISVTNGSKGAFTKLSALQYTLVVTPAANSAGNIGVSIAANTFADLVGNKVTVATTASQAFDTRPPTLTVTNDIVAPTASGNVTFTFVFSKDVGTSFTTEDVVVTGGTKGAFTRVSGTQATLVVIPTANTSGTLNVSVAVGAFSDLAGATNTAAASAQKAFSTIVKTQMTLPVSFDVATVDYGFIGFGGAEDSSLAPDPTNAANRVAKVVRAAGSEVFAGTTITGAAQLGFTPKIAFNANQTKMSVRVFSPDAGIPVRLKVEDHGDPNKSVETEVLTTTAGAWQTLTFDFSKQATGTAAMNLAFNYDKATIFFDFLRAKAAAVQKTYYFDDITLLPPGVVAPAAPTIAADTPPARAAADVLSIYSDAYTPVPNIDLNPNWGQNTVASDVTIVGNKTRRYANLNYQGIDWAGNPINVTAMTKLHIDVWTADVTSVKISVISAGKENPVTLTPTLAGWNSFDIDMAQFTAADKTAVIQIKIEGTPAGTLYFDNLYFWKPAASGGGGCAAPNCVDFSGSGIGFGPFENPAGTVAIANDPLDASNKVVKFVKKAADPDYFGTVITGLGVSPLLTASSKTVTMRVFSPRVGTNFLLKFEGGSGGPATTEKDVVTTVANAWETLSFVMPDVGTYTTVVVFPNGRSRVTADTTMYIDDLKFPAVAPVGGGGPACVDMGCAGPQALTLSTGDSKGIFAAGEAILAFDYKGSRDAAGNFASYVDGRSDGTPGAGTVGYYNDVLMSTSAQKLDEGGWIAGTSLDAGGIPNFFRYFVLRAPASTFASSYLGLFANAPNNGTLNVSGFSSLKFRLWGPAEMYQQGNLNPVLEVVLAGPKVAGCGATGSGGTEIAKTFTANQKIGAASGYKLSLSGWTVKGVCGADTNATAVASVLSKVARFAVTAPASSFNFINANPGAVPSYSSGVNLGPIGFTNN